MSRSARELCAALAEACVDDPDGVDLEDLAALVEARAPLVREVEAVAPSLAPDDRAALAEAVQRVLAADRAVIESVRRRQRAVTASLRSLVDGRGAVRGYRREAGAPGRGAILERA